MFTDTHGIKWLHDNKVGVAPKRNNKPHNTANQKIQSPCGLLLSAWCVMKRKLRHAIVLQITPYVDDKTRKDLPKSF